MDMRVSEESVLYVTGYPKKKKGRNSFVEFRLEPFVDAAKYTAIGKVVEDHINRFGQYSAIHHEPRSNVWEGVLIEGADAFETADRSREILSFAVPDSISMGMLSEDKRRPHVAPDAPSLKELHTEATGEVPIGTEEWLVIAQHRASALVDSIAQTRAIASMGDLSPETKFKSARNAVEKANEVKLALKQYLKEAP
jgi:hypothetical protein